MKKLLLLFSFSLLGLATKAQLSFEKIYSIHTWTQGLDVIEGNSGNLICIGWDCSAQFDLQQNETDRYTGIIFKLNSVGDTIKKVFIGLKDTIPYSNFGKYTNVRVQRIIHATNQEYFVASSFIPFNPSTIYEAGVMLMKIDENLDTLWTKEIYSLGSQTIIWNCCPTRTGGFAITGKRTISSPLSVYTFLIVVDSLGNTLLDRNYSPNSPFFRIASQGIVETSEGGYFITGTQDDLNDNSQPYCIRTDSSGNELWRILLPYTTSYNGAYNIVKTNDGNYVFSWYTQSRIGTYLMWTMHISKIDESGSFIWTRDYFPTYDVGNFLKEMPNGNLAMYGSYTDTLGLGRQGMLVICDSSGQLLSVKKYQSNSLWSLMAGNFTSDGEMIFCGDTYCCNNSSPLGTTSSLWIFKTDSLGYITATGELAEELKRGIKWIDPYPNPSTGIFNMDVELSEKLDVFTMDVYDIYSRKIESIKLNKGKNVFQLDLSAEKNGQYLVVVAAKDFKMQVKKVIVNR